MRTGTICEGVRVCYVCDGMCKSALEISDLERDRRYVLLEIYPFAENSIEEKVLGYIFFIERVTVKRIEGWARVRYGCEADWLCCHAINHVRRQNQAENESRRGVSNL